MIQLDSNDAERHLMCFNGRKNERQFFSNLTYRHDRSSNSTELF